jgi:hypothetical protein
MTTVSTDPRTLEELRDWVHQALCSRENLLLEESPLNEMVLRKGDEVCGLQFFVQGPRLVRLSAVWSLDQNQLYCYDADGERYLKHQLSHPIPLSLN